MLYYKVVHLKFMLLTNVTQINLIKKQQHNSKSVSIPQKSIINALRKLEIKAEQRNT